MLWYIVAIVVVLGFVAYNHRPAKRSVEEVASTLRALLNGTLDSEEWDFFVSVSIQDPRLESIRKRCVALWKDESPYLDSGAIDPTRLSELGRRMVKDLLDECEQRTT